MDLEKEDQDSDQEKVWYQSVKEMKSYYNSIGLGVLCKLIGKTRQAFYKSRSRKERQLFDASIIVALVVRERQTAKRVGSRRLLLILAAELEAHKIKIGRQKFIEVLRENDLLVKVNQS